MRFTLQTTSTHRFDALWSCDEPDDGLGTCHLTHHFAGNLHNPILREFGCTLSEAPEQSFLAKLLGIPKRMDVVRMETCAVLEGDYS
jgi:hypothetical protein